MSDSAPQGESRKRVMKKLDLQIADAEQEAAATPDPDTGKEPPSDRDAEAQAPPAPEDIEDLPADVQFKLMTGQAAQGSGSAAAAKPKPEKSKREEPIPPAPEPDAAAATPAPEAEAPPKPPPAPDSKPKVEPKAAAAAPQTDAAMEDLPPDVQFKMMTQQSASGISSAQAQPEEPATKVDTEARAGTTDNPEEEIPDRVADRYEVVRVIGRGGMGMVLLARDERLQRHVAIKRLFFRSQNMKIVQRRFLREAQTIASLGHQNIVNIYDIGQDDQVGYITMEYIPGPAVDKTEDRTDPPMGVNLDQYIKIEGPMEPESAVEFMLKICSAVAYAHKRGTIHRDIKPSNILLTEDKEPKVVDFGLARPIDISKTEEITLEGTMLGTPEYSAPEQWGDIKTVGTPADVYALGGVFWFMLSGRIPRFFRESDVPPHLSPIITKALSQKPSDRYQTVPEMMTALQQIQEGDLDDLPSGVDAAAAAAPPSDQAKKTDTPTSDVHEGWLCPACNQYSPNSANFCVHCGASGQQTCPMCGSNIKVGIQYCPNCGEDVEVAEESAGILLAAKNHADFLEYETALEKIKPLAKKNAEAKELSRKWHEIVLRRRNLMMELDSALRVFNLSKAVDVAKGLRDLVPEECLSEAPDFNTVVKHSELITSLRKLLVESATRSHEEHNLERFASSITALNQIFGEDVCGAINSQLLEILNTLDRMLTEAGLATGMNCHSRALEIINSVPPWKGGELGDRRVRLYTNCKQQVEERERAIDEIEAAIREKEYSKALSMIRKMSRFRLPPDHSEMSPAQEDLAAHERIIKIDKILINTIDENIKDWIQKNKWEDIRNSLLILKEGETRKWKDLLDRLKRATNREVVNRYNRASELERKGSMSKAEKAWVDFLLIPPELAPPHLIEEAAEFPTRRREFQLARAGNLLKKGSIVLALLWAYYLVELILFPILKIAEESEVTFRFGWVPLILEGLLFVGVLIVSHSKLMRKLEKQADDLPASPRLLALALLVTLSPFGMIFYQAYWDWVYLDFTTAAWHPIFITTGAFFILDLSRGFRLRFPTCLSLTLSGFVMSLFVSVMYHNAPAHIHRERFWIWPVAAILQAVVFLVIQSADYKLHLTAPEPDTPPEPEEQT